MGSRHNFLENRHTFSNPLHRLGLLLLKGVGHLPYRHTCGCWLGGLLHCFIGHRRRVVETNLRLAFPDISDTRLRQLTKRHFTMVGIAVMDMLWALSADHEELRRYIQIKGDIPKFPCILFTPHFLGLELINLRLVLGLNQPIAYFYKQTRGRFWNFALLYLRNRYGGKGYEKSSKYSFLKAAHHVRKGGIFAYFPDVDPRNRKSTVFVP